MKLTPREIQVLKLIVSGQSTKMIAEQLFISIRTVDSHRDNIRMKFRKLGASNLAQLISIAKDENII